MRQLRIFKQVTNRETASFEKYLQEIGRESLITSEEEVELAQRIKNGDVNALEKLTKANLRFVVSVSKQYQNQGLGLQDLINEGNLGLIKAAQRFDETKGFKFISYAVWWIRQSILLALAEQARLIRLPLNKVGILNKITKTIIKLEQDKEREPTIDEISEALDMSASDILDALRHTFKHKSMDAPVNNEDDVSLYDLLSDDDMIQPDNNLLINSLKDEIDRVISSLTPREAEIIKLYYGLGYKHPLTLEEIGETFGLSRERVRQIKEKAIRRLKNSQKSRILIKYLG
ncbi:MAG: RNA polymerase subunit sigma [Bacteroidetes bacterium GWE2_29_8]|nr:MAG: RNA polymerase subunit sigma [Bacteroidetes bacterium GWE2_29_8]